MISYLRLFCLSTLATEHRVLLSLCALITAEQQTMAPVTDRPFLSSRRFSIIPRHRSLKMAAFVPAPSIPPLLTNPKQSPWLPADKQARLIRLACYLISWAVEWKTPGNHPISQFDALSLCKEAISRKISLLTPPPQRRQYAFDFLFPQFVIYIFNFCNYSHSDLLFFAL